MKRRSLLTFAILMLFTGLCHTAFADSLVLTLDNPDQNLTPGQTASFSGTVSAPLTNAGDFYLTGDSSSPLPSGFVFDGSPLLFLSPTFPIDFQPGGSVSGELFSIMIPVDAPLTLFQGTFYISGGSDPSDDDIVASADFSITPTAATPEPSGWLLMGTGMFSLILILRTKRAHFGIFPHA